jgi:hypothetical protein
LSVFGFAHTNFGLVTKRCRDALGPNSVQVVAGRETLLRRRCYVVLGVDSLDAIRVRLLNRSSAILVIVDSLPALSRVSGINILDAAANSVAWNPIRVRFASLEQSLRAKPHPLKFNVAKDSTLDNMIVSIKERSVLDSVLSAAKSLESSDRALLHTDVAQLLIGKISMANFKRRCTSRGVSGRLYEKMITRLSDDTAKRLSVALKQAKDGEEVTAAASKLKVEPSEIRFLLAKLRKT